ncbi:MAG: hypothetical protein KAT05_07495 [Spirochaetes bacterium]|nr:hypothetical protein [Spirochaetota bacterium]
MQFKAYSKNIEVNGQTVYSIVDGLGNFKSLAKKYLLSVGIGEEVDNELVIKLDAWYSHDKWLEAFESIAKEIGDNTLNLIGKAIPKNAKFPPWVKDIESAVQSIDIAYHMNHRKNGKGLFDPNSGKKLGGIGHYGYEKIEGKNIIICECDNPYPCAFDMGIISTMAKKFEINANVIHDNSKPCRKNGADTCTYIVTW